MKKLGPFSVRIDKEHFEFVQQEQNIEKAQELVSWIFRDYFVKNKLVKEQMNTMLAGFPAMTVQPHKISVPVSKTYTQEPVIDQYQAYLTEIDNATGIYQIEMTAVEFRKDNSITSEQRRKLESYAKDKSATFD